MFYLFKPAPQPEVMFNTFLEDFNAQMVLAQAEFNKQIEAFKKIDLPTVTQTDDVVTITFKGPNVTTMVTASAVKMPEILKQFGLEMPKLATTPKKAKAND